MKETEPENLHVLTDDDELTGYAMSEPVRKEIRKRLLSKREEGENTIDLNMLPIRVAIGKIIDYIEEKKPFQMQGPGIDEKVVKRLNQAIDEASKKEKPLRKR